MSDSITSNREPNKEFIESLTKERDKYKQLLKEEKLDTLGQAQKIKELEEVKQTLYNSAMNMGEKVRELEKENKEIFEMNTNQVRAIFKLEEENKLMEAIDAENKEFRKQEDSMWLRELLDKKEAQLEKLTKCFCDEHMKNVIDVIGRCRGCKNKELL